MPILLLRQAMDSLTVNCICPNYGFRMITRNSAKYDTDHVEKARMILETHLENPPSVSDLAGMVGVSPAKLKQIFLKAYGMPPYCYLRKLRMEKAMGLLNSGQMNVTETAYEVGYNSLSHFAGLFARQFAIKPSEVYKISERPPALTPF